MANSAPPSVIGAPSFSSTGARQGFHALRFGSALGLLGQTLIWGAVIALWIVGSLYGSIPVTTQISYGANGFSVGAGAIFDLNYLLILGTVAALVSSIVCIRGYRAVGKATPGLNFDMEIGLAALGAFGFGMFGVGWAIWLGSFAPPGIAAPLSPSAYTPVMSANIGVAVTLLLFIGGLLAFLGAIGTAMGNLKIGAPYEEGALEMGAVLCALPALSITGQLFGWVGFADGERKLASGWSPPPPPPPPAPPVIQPVMVYPGAYIQSQPVASGGSPGNWDALAVVLVVLLVVLWGFVLPFAFVVSNATTKGPASAPIGNGSGGPVPGSSPAAQGGASLTLPVLLVILVATSIMLPLAISRNRRKRRRSAQLTAPPPPPPPSQPPSPAGPEDPLGHLV